MNVNCKQPFWGFNTMFYNILKIKELGSLYDNIRHECMLQAPSLQHKESLLFFRHKNTENTVEIHEINFVEFQTNIPQFKTLRLGPDNPPI